MTRPVLAVAVAAAMLAASAQAVGGAAFPKRIALPNGFQPEGIAIAGQQFYAGSIPTGAVYRGSLRTGRGSVLVRPAAGRAAIGLDVSRGLVFVAGGATGRAFVYDAETGKDVAAFQLAAGPGATFVNDVVVTKRVAWFTDSFRPVLYRVPLRPNGAPGAQAGVRTVALTGEIVFGDGFNLNGIDATANGRTLIVVQSATGKLFTVVPRTGFAKEIDLGGESVPNGDGILLAGTTLYVVQNRDDTVAKIALQPSLRSGRIVSRITDPTLDVPTTIAAHGSRLYAVNARFATSPTPSTPYWVTRLAR
jgi:sugar lactone lactonase YvrE